MMKVLKYGIGSQKGFEAFTDELSFRIRMKALHAEKVRFTPQVLVEGIPGTLKPVWKELNEYTKLLKKEEASDESKN